MIILRTIYQITLLVLSCVQDINDINALWKHCRRLVSRKSVKTFGTNKNGKGMGYLDHSRPSNNQVKAALGSLLFWVWRNVGIAYRLPGEGERGEEGNISEESGKGEQGE